MYSAHAETALALKNTLGPVVEMSKQVLDIQASVQFIYEI